MYPTSVHYLTQKHKKILSLDRLDITFDYWGYGWVKIVDQLCTEIQRYIDRRLEERKRDMEYNRMVQAGLDGDLSPLRGEYNNYQDLDRTIESILKNGLREIKPEVPQVVVYQIAQDLGRMRFRYHGGDDHVRGLVNMAIGYSSITCQQCGEPGQVASEIHRWEGCYNWWTHVLCDKHAAKHTALKSWAEEEKLYGRTRSVTEFNTKHGVYSALQLR